MENEIEIDYLKIYIDQTTELIAAFTNSMRQLSLSALDLQALALSKRHRIEKQIDAVDDLGNIIEELIQFQAKLIACYISRYDQLQCRPNAIREAAEVAEARAGAGELEYPKSEPD
ncbi:MAG TPA: hypothetical protein DDW65_04340 [Firmicutes bacterium]|jgi:hypothetical protein|nr:hypothetical protein [Bacillota bacterium]